MFQSLVCFMYHYCMVLASSLLTLITSNIECCPIFLKLNNVKIEVYELNVFGWHCCVVTVCALRSLRKKITYTEQNDVH